MNSSKFQLNHGSHFNAELQKEFKEFGESNFQFEIIDKLEPKEDSAYNYTDDLKALEFLWIEKLQPFEDKGYNKKSRAPQKR